jgi:predicted 2-oxoglutarate/Fe(II)-dependent dioxygenase YbiX
MASRNSPCTCGSGERYKNCCGSLVRKPEAAASIVAADGSSPYTEIGYFREEFRRQGMLPFCQDMPPGLKGPLDQVPPGVIVVDQYLDAASCTRWRDYFARQRTAPATIQDISTGAGKRPLKFKLDEQRVTEFVSYPDLKNEVQEVLVGAYRDVITPHFSQKLDWMAQPEVLKYVPGGLYNGHADSEYWDMNSQKWARSMDRDFSLLLYVNDDYEGGSLYFQNFDLRIKPGKGMLIAFPSDHRYLHAAEPLISGERYVAVCWATVKDSLRINPVSPDVIRA